jgi:hypothetical protein
MEHYLNGFAEMYSNIKKCSCYVLYSVAVKYV